MNKRRAMMLEEPVGTAEVAERLGVQQKTVWEWGKQGKMPEPAMKIGRARIWEWAVIEEWADKTGRLDGKHKGGRPKKTQP